MRVWRLCRRAHARLDGEGARVYGGRWNSPGRAVVYASDHLSLAVLEQLVHLDIDELPDDYVAIEIEVPPSAPKAEIAVADLPAGWAELADPWPCRDLGDRWLEDGKSLVLSVPSAIIPREKNRLLNPAHPAMREVGVLSVEPFRFDPRLRGSIPQ